jgi:hypothetical protein
VEKFMDKKAILELRNYILNKIYDFSEYYKNENIYITSFSDWNARDVIGHINRWIKFSEDKFESIKLNKSFEDVNHADIEKFNKINYENNKNKSLETIVNESKMILEKYENILELFDEEELSGNKFPTGFSFELWKYMAMDLGIHPLMHILYHNIKRMDYHEFIKEIERSRKYFIEYSGNDIKEYDFTGLFENREGKEEGFKELKEIGKGNKLIEEIIELNIER